MSQFEKLVLDILLFLLKRKILELKGDYRGEIKNIMDASYLLGSLESYMSYKEKET